MIVKKDFTDIQNLINEIWKLITAPQVSVLFTLNFIILIGIYIITDDLNYDLSYWFIKDYLLTILPFFPLLIDIKNQSIISLFKSKTKEIFRVLSFTLFISSEYTFSIWSELILVIVVFILVFLSTYSKHFIDTKIKLFDVILGLIIIGTVINSLRLFIINIEDIATLAFWLSFALEFVVWFLNIPTLFILQLMMLFEKKVNTSMYGKHLYSYILVLFHFIKARIYFNGYLGNNKSITNNITEIKELGMAGGGSRVLVIIDDYIDKEDLIRIIGDLIFDKNQYTTIENTREKYPSIIEVRNTKYKLLAFWEWPRLNDKFKNKLYPRENNYELKMGIHVTEEYLEFDKS